MGLLTWIIVGLIAGWVAGLVMKGGGYGVVGDIILGIIGALVGGFLAGALLHLRNPINGFNPTTLIVAIIGAIVVIAIFRAIPRRGRI